MHITPVTVPPSSMLFERAQDGGGEPSATREGMQVKGSLQEPVVCVVSALSHGPVLRFGADEASSSDASELCFGIVEVLKVPLCLTILPDDPCSPPCQLVSCNILF